jgi:hypothetical protein
MGGVIPVSTRVERRTGVGDAGFTAAAGTVNGECCWPGVPILPADADSSPAPVWVVVMMRNARGVGFESTAVRGASTSVRDPGSETAPVPRLVGSAEAMLESVGVGVAASAAFAQRREVDAIAFAVRPNR